MSSKPFATKISALQGTTRQLDAPIAPREIVTEEDVQQPKKLAELVQRLTIGLTELRRRFAARRIDFEDVTIGTAGAKTLLAHRFNGRVRWSVVGWQTPTPGALFDDAVLWVRRAFFGPLTLATAAANVTVGCRFQLTARSYVSGARFAWFNPGGPRTITVKLWRDSDGALLASGTVGVNNSGCYTAAFTRPVLLEGSNLNTDLTISVYDGGTNITRTGLDAAFTGLFNLSLPGVILKSINLAAVGDARPTVPQVGDLYWVEPYLSPPSPGLIEDTTASDANTLALQSYVPGIVSIRVEEAG